MRYRGFIPAAILGLALAPTAAVFAQDNPGLSAEELRRLFEGQKTRGLVIAPAAETPADSTVPAAADGTAVAAADGYVEMEKDLQVNIQVQFDFDSATLKESEKPKLVALCEAMKSVDVKVFRIIGHTDAAGSVEYNEKLSQLRAEEVKRYLVGDCGIDEARLEAVGVGKAHLYDPENPRADVNRRVEFQVVS